MSIAAISVSGSEKLSETRDLPALKMAAADLDAILLKTHSLIDAANGAEDSGSEMVKFSIGSQEIEIPHLSFASSMAFPNEVFRFVYSYRQPDKPISSVIIDLSDSLRRVSVSGEAADQVQQLSHLLEDGLRRYSTAAGGLKFRRVTGTCLSMFFLTSLMISGAYCWNSRNRAGLGMLVCSAIGLLLVLWVPWQRLLPGFVLYQQYSPFFLVRHASEFFVASLLAAIAGVPLFYFISRKQRQPF